MRRFAWAGVGAVIAWLASTSLDGCSYFDDCDEIVRSVGAGTYTVDESMPSPGLRGDSDYRIVVAADGHVTEAFVRAGRRHENVYRIQATTRSALRSDRSERSTP